MIIDPQSQKPLLEKVLSRTLEHDDLDVSASVEWVRQNLTAQARKAAVVQAWTKSSLPLAAWARDVSQVDVLTSDECVGLTLQVQLADGRLITQEPPVSASRLKDLQRIAPCALPPIMADLLQSAPGLSLMPRTSLLPTEFLIRPLSRLTYWLNVTDPEEVTAYGYEPLDPKIHAMEVADVAVEYYVIGKDGTLYYFDENVIAGLTPCLVSLDQLFRIYFQNPSLLESPYEHGLAYLPSAARTLATQAPIAVADLGNRPSKLTGLGLLALAVRNCQRALPEGCRVQVPDDWDRVIDVLRQIIGALEGVCTMGVPLAPRIAEEMAEQSRDCATALLSYSTEAMKAKNSSVTSCYLGHMLGFAVTELAKMGTLTDLPLNSMAYDATPVIQNIPTTHRAAIRDADALIRLELGAPGTRGDVVPAGFFQKPLWPEGMEG